MAVRGGFMIFGEIKEPGAYLIEQTGHLMRVPPDALAVGRSPIVSIASNEPVRVTLLCRDPWVPIGQARKVAANLDLNVAF